MLYIDISSVEGEETEDSNTLINSDVEVDAESTEGSLNDVFSLWSDNFQTSTPSTDDSWFSESDSSHVPSSSQEVDEQTDQSFFSVLNSDTDADNVENHINELSEQSEEVVTNTSSTDDNQNSEVLGSSNSQVASVSSQEDVLSGEQNTVPSKERGSKRELLTGSPEIEPSKKPRISDNAGNGKICSMCCQLYTSSGEHRICALKCGHLFGHSCLQRNLDDQPKTRRSCPTCKRRVKKQDIRLLYVKGLTVLDVKVVEELRQQLKQVTERMYKLRTEQYQKKETWNRRILDLRLQMESLKTHKLRKQDECKPIRLLTQSSVEVDPKGGCRVFAYEAQSGTLAVSAHSPSGIWSGWGIRKFSVPGYRSTAFIAAHTKPIRDLVIRDNKLLSVSLDCRAKLTDLHNNSELISITCGSPIWSGCFHLEQENQLWLGESHGSVTLWDIRNTREYVSLLEVPGDGSPVVSLASAHRNTLLCCKLNSCWVFQGEGGGGRPLSNTLEGPFMSLRYEPTTDRVLVSSRPNHRRPYTRHSLLQNGQPLREFEGAPVQSKLTRSCLLSCGDQAMVAAYHETNSNIALWHVSGRRLISLPAHSPVLDLAHIQIKQDDYLCSLTENKLNFYYLTK